MQITLRNSCSPSVYLLDGVILPTVSSCIDLGVYMDSALSFSSHIDHIITKTKRRASQILRCFYSKDRDVHLLFIRPIIEYCSPVWSPYTVTGINIINIIESVSAANFHQETLTPALSTAL